MFSYRKKTLTVFLYTVMYVTIRECSVFIDIEVVTVATNVKTGKIYYLG